MTRNVNQSPKQEEIQPWSVQDSTQLNPIQSTMLRLCQPVIRQTISLNPQITLDRESQTKRPMPKSHNFFDNLRKYELKKTVQESFKGDKNFIEKNKQKLMEDVLIESQESKNRGMLINNMLSNKKTIRNIQAKISSRVNPINWSLIMYYETEKNRRKPYHKDIQSFLRFQSHRKTIEKERLGTRQNSQVNQDTLLTKQQEEIFQKEMKLKESIRKRHLKSASPTIIIEQNDPPTEQLKQSQNYTHRAFGFVQFQKKMITKTSNSARMPLKSNPVACKIEIVGNKNAIIAKKEPLSEIRVIHSSQKNSRINRLLNINGRKVQNSQKFTINI